MEKGKGKEKRLAFFFLCSAQSEPLKTFFNCLDFKKYCIIQVLVENFLKSGPLLYIDGCLGLRITWSSDPGLWVYCGEKQKRWKKMRNEVKMQNFFLCFPLIFFPRGGFLHRPKHYRKDLMNVGFLVLSLFNRSLWSYESRFGYQGRHGLDYQVQWEKNIVKFLFCEPVSRIKPVSELDYFHRWQQQERR